MQYLILQEIVVGYFPNPTKVNFAKRIERWWWRGKSLRLQYSIYSKSDKVSMSNRAARAGDLYPYCINEIDFKIWLLSHLLFGCLKSPSLRPWGPTSEVGFVAHYATAIHEGEQKLPFQRNRLVQIFWSHVYRSKVYPSFLHRVFR